MTLPHRLAEYNSPEGAREYLEEYQKLHRRFSDARERRVLARFLARMEALETALDLPCGWGRYLPFLRQKAPRVVQADYSGEMLRLGSRLLADTPVLGRLRASGTDIPLADRCVDLVFSMRLSHHLADPAQRRRHLDEILRVARHYVVFSYFDAGTLKNRLRRLRARFSPRKPKNTLTRAMVEDQLRAAGFQVLAAPLLFPLGSGHRLVFAERVR
ncbi:MAG: class I SAM-dependent methyltransferase [Planctomycetota bacterium]|nr:MAG: class I SAM-dependent methyltransferase [Planctomycetota bacterium]